MLLLLLALLTITMAHGLRRHGDGHGDEPAKSGDEQGEAAKSNEEEEGE